MKFRFKDKVTAEGVCKMLADKKIKVLQVTKDPNNLYWYYTVFYKIKLKAQQKDVISTLSAPSKEKSEPKDI